MHWITELYTPKVCTFFKKKRLFFNAGIEIRIGDRWKPVTIEKSLEKNRWKNFLLFEKKTPIEIRGTWKKNTCWENFELQWY